MISVGRHGTEGSRKEEERERGWSSLGCPQLREGRFEGSQLPSRCQQRTQFEQISAGMKAFEHSVRFEYDGEDIDPPLPDDRRSKRNTCAGASSVPDYWGQAIGDKERKMRERAER
jgi:hypothetical protein